MNHIQDKINKLSEFLNYHNHKYYVEDKPEISDFEYDALMNELKKLENEFPQYFSPQSPTQRVGGVALDKFEKSTVVAGSKKGYPAIIEICSKIY